MKENTCCFTGHRKLPANKIQNILANLDREIEKLILLTTWLNKMEEKQSKI